MTLNCHATRDKQDHPLGLPDLNVTRFDLDLTLPPGLALGCARFGSVNGATPNEAMVLLDLAYHRGVRVFDTAASYGQGDSERVLGRFARRYPDVCIVTKLGKIVPLKARLLQFAKPLLRALGRRSSRASGAIRASRGDRLGTRFDLAYLKDQFAGSQQRLGLARVPVVLLHSPSAEVIAAGEALAFLDAERRAGTIGLIGISVDDAAAAEAALADPRVQVIQLPLAAGDDWAGAMLPTLKACGKAVIAREIFRDADLGRSEGRAGRLFEALQRVTQAEGVTTTLIGTIRRAHLDELLTLHAALTTQGPARIE